MSGEVQQWAVEKAREIVSWHIEPHKMFEFDIARALQEVRDAERERCAKLMDEHDVRAWGLSNVIRAGEPVAHAIRAGEGGGEREMSVFHSCERCGGLVWTGKNICLCKPLTYQVKQWGQDGDDWTTAHFKGDAEDAAREIVSEDYWADPGNPNDIDVIVTFRDERGCTISYQVTAEATVDFSAREVELEEEPRP